MKTALVVMGIVAVVLCIVCGIGLFFFGRGALQGLQAISRTGEQFLAHLQANEFNAAVQLIAPSARSIYTEAELRKRWGILENAIGKVRGWSVWNYEIHASTGGDVGTLAMRVQGDRGSGTVGFTFKREGGRWLITELRFGW
ncbi:MAG: hypothetical protein KatS3mg016_1986 [Fimbriimonadales bacterium]|nr:MAG: hypothetical protein KatS3mg016_0511 [Fimbriimonadales bacterium]GIV06411.1 MAG: hypothetical protein KatS3mg016_1986 [Fimbriimonadales bacterium]GIV06945.1 MAG: hypothetical protein KatS3mg017_0147 [Fimbriimonadales bacterium]